MTCDIATLVIYHVFSIKFLSVQLLIYFNIISGAAQALPKGIILDGNTMLGPLWVKLSIKQIWSKSCFIQKPSYHIQEIYCRYEAEDIKSQFPIFYLKHFQQFSFNFKSLSIPLQSPVTLNYLLESFHAAKCFDWTKY